MVFSPRLKSVYIRGANVSTTDKQRMALHIEHTPLAVIEWEHESRLITFWNPAAQRMFGYSAAEVVGKRTADLIVPEAEHRALEPIWRGLPGTDNYKSVNTNLTKDGRLLTCEWYNTPLRNEQDELIGVAALALDITKQVATEQALRESEQRLRYQATHDSLTGLKNRYFFTESLNALCERRLPDKPFALLLLDLNGFKHINDTLGHPSGDEVLAHVAKRFAHCLRADTVLARLGGDEFAVLLDDAGELRAVLSVAERLTASLASPIVLLETLSVGVSGFVSIMRPLHLKPCSVTPTRPFIRPKRKGAGLLRSFMRLLSRQRWAEKLTSRHVLGIFRGAVPPVKSSRVLGYFVKLKPHLGTASGKYAS